MATVQRASMIQYPDGQVAIHNIRKKRPSIPVFGSNESYSATLVNSWWDGTPMDDSKADGNVYFKLKKLPSGADSGLSQYIGSYFKVNLPNDGELFLEKDAMQEMRDLNSTEILLLQMGYYKGVKLNGYYEKGDTPAPINYIISTTTEEDDGGSIIETGGIKLEHDFRGEVNILYFGIVPEVDFVSDEINKVILKYDEVTFNRGVYRADSPLTVKSGSRLRGVGTVIQGLFTIEQNNPENEGGYPTQLLTNLNKDTGDSNISIEGITFDFGRSIVRSSTGPGLTMVSGAHFKNVTGIRFIDTSFINYISNRNTDITESAEFYMDWSTIAMEDCSSIDFDGLLTRYIREEGFVLLRCKGVSIRNWEGDGSGGLSSQGAFWYCDGVTIRDSRLYANAGSVFNLYSSNILVSNVQVNKGMPRWGRGIDIGNELGYDLTYEPSNITIENSYFNVFSYGIGTSLGGIETQKLRNVSISNNYISVNQQMGGGLSNFLRGIIISNPSNWHIKNNTIIMGPAPIVTQGAAFYYGNSRLEDFVEGVSIDGNTVTATTFFFYNIPTTAVFDVKLRSLLVKDNTFYCLNTGGLDSSAGANNFIALKDYSTSEGSINISNIDIVRNRVYNLTGGFYMENIISSNTLINTDVINIDNNTFRAPEGGLMTQGLRMRLNGRAQGEDTNGVVQIINNKLYGSAGLRISAQEDVIIKDNILDRRGSDLNANSISVEGVVGSLSISGNVFKDVSSSYGTVTNLTSSIIPANIYIEDNVAFNNAGSRFFSQGDFLSSPSVNTSFIKSVGASLVQGDGGQLVGNSVNGSITYSSVSNGNGFPTAAGLVWTFNRSTNQGTFSLFKENSANGNLWIQGYNSAGIGQGWQQLGAPDPLENIGNITTPDASDESTAVALVNEVKGVINTLIGDMKVKGLME